MIRINVSKKITEANYTRSDDDMYANKPITVYDINKFIETETDGEYIAYDYQDGACIIVQDDGTGIIVDYEAVGEEFHSVNDKFELGINKKPEEKEEKSGFRTIYVMPAYLFTTSIKEIMDNAPSKKVTVKDFFTKRSYNHRCARNFAEIIPFLK